MYGFLYIDDCDLIADREEVTEVHRKLSKMLKKYGTNSWK